MGFSEVLLTRVLDRKDLKNPPTAVGGFFRLLRQSQLHAGTVSPQEMGLFHAAKGGKRGGDESRLPPESSCPRSFAGNVLVRKVKVGQKNYSRSR